MSTKGKKILITGSSGMLGSDLCEALKDGFHMIGLDLNAPANSAVSPDVFYKISLERMEDIEKVIDEEAPDTVIHAAAWTDVDGCEGDHKKAESANIKCTENLVDLLVSRKRVPLLFLSTDYVFDGEKRESYLPDDPVSPLSIYGKTKAEAEKVIMKRLDNYAIIRTSWLFGEHGKNFVDTIINKADEVKEFKVVDDQVASPTFSKDLAVAILNILEKDIFPGQYVLHITNSGKCSWYEFAVKILDKLDMKNGIPVNPISSFDMDRPAKRPHYSVLDNSGFNEIAGYGLRKWEDALEAYLNERV